MSTEIQNAFGLEQIDDLLKSDENYEVMQTSPSDGEDIKQESVERDLDKISEDVLKHAADLMDLGYNVDTKSAPKIFDSAANMYKLALEAVKTKRDTQLRTARHNNELKKIEMEKRIKKGEVVPNGNDVGDDDMVYEDRNDLLRKIKEARELENKTSDEAK